MLLEKIKLNNGKILVQPSSDATSSFSTESKKYDRKAVGVVKGVPKNCRYSVGEKIIYDDSDSIDFTIDGVALSIVDEWDIVATIEEEE